MRDRQRDLRRNDARGRGLARPAALGLIAAAALLAPAAPAAATMIIGQVAPGNPVFASCTTPQSTDFLEPTSITTAGYFVKEAGTITSWSTNPSLGPGQMYTMKIFRKVDDPATYQVIGHDGPRTLAPGSVNTFSASVAVQPGDILGFNESGGSNACTFSAPGDSVLMRNGSLSDGNSGAFTTLADRRLNINAVLDPSNAFSLAGIARNRANGTATLTINVSNPGILSIAGKGVSAASGVHKAAVKETTQAGPVEVRIKAKGRSRRTLAKTGKLKVKPRITFSPNNGASATQAVKVKLKLKR